MTRVILALTEADIQTLITTCKILSSLKMDDKDESEIAKAEECQVMINDITTIAFNEYKLQHNRDGFSTHKTQKTYRLSGLCEEIDRVIDELYEEHPADEVLRRIENKLVRHINCRCSAIRKENTHEEEGKKET